MRQWEELFRLTAHPAPKEGKFTLADGREVVKFFTAHGDGVYLDRAWRQYTVDSGTIGCILVADIKSDAGCHPLGNVTPFPDVFLAFNEDGVMTFGHVVIDTEV